ncbi:MAG: MaoC family dehydratase [Candidatus Rokubacteria bacterium]|nr:MaoC family dehydratase [Candidatus Rokubacteria bacterium]
MGADRRARARPVLSRRLLRGRRARGGAARPVVLGPGAARLRDRVRSHARRPVLRDEPRVVRLLRAGRAGRDPRTRLAVPVRRVRGRAGAGRRPLRRDRWLRARLRRVRRALRGGRRDGGRGDAAAHGEGPVTYYFEDFKVGDAWEFGAWSLTREELIAFAREYDPQPIHTDDAAAGRTAFGGVIASGWQTTLKCIRLFVDGLMRETAGLASPGLDELRWLKPVRPGARITARATVTEVGESTSRPDRGRVHFLISGVDESGEPVMTAKGLFFVARRPRRG